MDYSELQDRAEELRDGPGDIALNASGDELRAWLEENDPEYDADDGNEDVPEGTQASSEVEAPDVDGPVDVVMLWPNGDQKYVRTYEEDRHGEDYLELAEEFVAGNEIPETAPYVGWDIVEHDESNPEVR